MDVTQIQSVVAVADELHFGRVADRLLVSTSVVSRHVAQVERELGVRIFERSTRNVRITEAGQSVLAHARVMLEAASAIKRVRHHESAAAAELTVAYRPSAAGCGPDRGLPQVTPKHRDPAPRHELPRCQ